MKKYFGKAIMFLCLVIGMVTLASCNANSFKGVWNNVKYTDGNEKYVSLISLDEATNKINNKDSFVLILAAPNDATTAKMDILFSTMVELGYNTEGELFYVNSTDATELGSNISKYKKSLGVQSINDVSGVAFVVIGYTNGVKEFDTSDKNLDSNKKFSTDGSSELSSINYYALSQYILVDFNK